MKRCRLLTGSTVGGILLWSYVTFGGTAENGVELAYKFAKDEVLKYRTLMLADLSLKPFPPFQPQAGTNTINVRVEVTQKVKQVSADGTAEMDMTYGAFALDEKDPVYTKGFEFAPFGQSLEGRIFPLKISKQGEVLEMCGFAEIVGFPQVPAVFEYYAQLYLQGGKPRFPGKQLKIGESWHENEKVPGLNTKYTLLGFEELAGQECAKIDIEASIDLEGDTQWGQENMTLNIGTKGTGKGTFYFAHKQGKLVRYHMKINSDVFMPVPVYEEGKLEIKKVGTGVNLDTTIELQEETGDEK